MNEPVNPPHRRPRPRPDSDVGGGRHAQPSVTAIAADEAFLDALGRGESVADDPLANLMLEWRADLDEGLEQLLAEELEPALPEGVVDLTKVRRHRESFPRRAARLRLGRRAMVTAAASVAFIGSFGGVAVAASGAQPGNPLFTVTRVIYPTQAESRQARHDAQLALEQATVAAREGRPEDARKLLAKAEKAAKKVKSGSDAQKLRVKVNQVRVQLGQAPLPPVVDPTPAPEPSAAPSATPSPSAGPPVEATPSPTPEPSTQPTPTPTPSPSPNDTPSQAAAATQTAADVE